MELKTLEQAKSIREKKKELESKIADIAKSDPERAKKMSIALTVLSWKADRMIGDGLGGDKEMVALAPREEPVAIAVVEKPYVARIKKAISVQPTAKDGPVKKMEDVNGARVKVDIKPVDMSMDVIPTKKIETSSDVKTPYQTLMEKKKKNWGIIPGWKYLTPEEKALVDRMFM